MIWMFLDKYKNIGLLILRLGIGGMFIFHGAPKFFGGPERWENLGAAMAVFGIRFAPTVWGFMAAFAEFAGGICVILGFFFRPACMLLTLTMIVAATKLLNGGEGLGRAAHAIEDGIVFLSLIFIGPGKYSLDDLFRLKTRPEKSSLSG
jgi:putative oxidoreductase